MSKEATGENGRILGSGEYWKEVNRMTFFDRMMRDNEETNYYDTLKEVGNRANAAIEEVYEDLQAHIKSVRAIPPDRRRVLAKQVEALYDVCRVAGTFCSRKSECIGILELSSFYLPGTPFIDHGAVEKSIRMIKNWPTLFASECRDLVRQAADWGVSFAAGSDEQKLIFLEAVAQGKGREFLRDVLDEYESTDESADLRGSNECVIGSREYRTCLEQDVFYQDVPDISGEDYDALLQTALEQIASQLRRDLESNARENNYITAWTARALHDAVRELERCGINTGIADSAINDLAWYVGGDPDKIRGMQKKLNELGIVRWLEEDGIFGKATEDAVKKLIDDFSDFLGDPDKMHLLGEAIDAVCCASETIPGAVWKNLLRDVTKRNMQLLVRNIWKIAAKEYLKRDGYDVAALLVEHASQDSPNNLFFSQSHWVTQKIIESNRFWDEFQNLEKKIQRDPDAYAVQGTLNMDFQTSGDTDLYYGIGKCALKYSCERYPWSVRVKFTMDDTYNFDGIRTIAYDKEAQKVVKNFGDIGALANDAGIVLQGHGVMSVYRIYVEFEKTIELEVRR